MVAAECNFFRMNCVETKLNTLSLVHVQLLFLFCFAIVIERTQNKRLPQSAVAFLFCLYGVMVRYTSAWWMTGI